MRAKAEALGYLRGKNKNKNNSKCNNQYRGPSLRSRMTRFLVMLAKSNSKSKSKSKSNGNGKSNNQYGDLSTTHDMKPSCFGRDDKCFGC